MFYTPGGLKIRIPVEVAFSLIARLQPSKKAIDILRTADGLDKFNSFFTNAVFLILLYKGFGLWEIVTYSILADVLCVFMILFGIFTGPISSLIWRIHKFLPDIVRIILVFGLSFWILGIEGLKIAFITLLITFIVYDGIIQFLITALFKTTLSDDEIISGKWIDSAREYAMDIGIPTEQFNISTYWNGHHT